MGTPLSRFIGQPERNLRQILKISPKVADDTLAVTS
jgi:hypothetical protein